jgi:hypothetical protein
MMRRNLSTTLIIAGTLLLLAGLGTLTALGAEPARTAISQTRPTLTPTKAPASTRRPGGNHDNPTSVPSGRITGTVINLGTGAPAPGVSVAVGEVTVTTDANGNYDRSGMSSGNYRVALALTPEQGVPAQPPQNVDLVAGSTVVLHLAFQPLAASATATPAPALSAALPSTGAPASSGNGWPLLALGATLIVIGIALRRTGHRPG